MATFSAGNYPVDMREWDWGLPGIGGMVDFLDGFNPTRTVVVNQSATSFTIRAYDNLNQLAILRGSGDLAAGYLTSLSYEVPGKGVVFNYAGAFFITSAGDMLGTISGFAAYLTAGNSLLAQVSGLALPLERADALTDPALLSTADTLIGSPFDDYGLGYEGDDHLLGQGGNDTLDGGSGLDLLEGGSGNDTYLLQDEFWLTERPDTVIEASGQGTDTVITRLAQYTLPAQVENLAYLGSDNFTGAGNDLANVLAGGTGYDTFSGGDGSDTFRLTSWHWDTMTDFTPGDGGDRIQVDAMLALLEHYPGQGINPFATGHLRIHQYDGHTALEVDLDGPGANPYHEPLAILQGVDAATLTQANFGFDPQATPNNSGFHFNWLTTPDLVQALYVGFYGRPADPEGFAYWINRLDAEGRDYMGMRTAFATSAEFTLRYGNLGTQALIHTAYQQLFGRTPDAEGLAWYTKLIESGQTDYVRLVLDMMGGTQGDDIAVLQHRLRAANHLTDYAANAPDAYVGAEAISQAATALGLVGADAASLDSFVLSYESELFSEWARPAGSGGNYQADASIDYPGDRDSFAINLTAGHRYHIEVTPLAGSLADPAVDYLRLPDGSTQAWDGEFSAPTSGEFFIAIIGQADTLGAYQLSVTEP